MKTGTILTAVLAAAALSATGQAARAETLASVLEKWGLIGTWTVNCAAPPATDNGYITIAVKSGKVTYDGDVGGAHIIFPIVDAVIEPGGELNYKAYRPDEEGDIREVILVKGADRRIRTISNRSILTDKFTIRDGLLVPEGTAARWLSRCSDGAK